MARSSKKEAFDARLAAGLRAAHEEPDSGSGQDAQDQIRAEIESALETALSEVAESEGAREDLLARCAKVSRLEAMLGELDEPERVSGGGVRTALSRLRGVDTLSDLVDKGLVELARACGLERVIFSRVHGDHLIAEAIHFEHDPDHAELILNAWRRDPPELTHLLLEAELMRRRASALVLGAPADPRTYKPLVEATGTSSYVVAPILPSGRVVGFLHADHGPAGPDVNERDRENLSIFVEGFGFAAERTVLLERLRFQRKQIRQQMMSADALASELASTEIEIAEVGSSPEFAFLGDTATGAGPSRQLESLLTKREIDVLTLLATGTTNAQIADKLVLAEGTVKTHVKHILRKLRASNRAEAVSRYMRLSAAADRR